jgi:hypothetical protein
MYNLLFLSVTGPPAGTILDPVFIIMGSFTLWVIIFCFGMTFGRSVRKGVGTFIGGFISGVVGFVVCIVLIYYAYELNEEGVAAHEQGVPYKFGETYTDK